MNPKDINLLFISDVTTHVPVEENIKTMKAFELFKKSPSVSSPTSTPSKTTPKPLIISRSSSSETPKSERLAPTWLNQLINQMGARLDASNIWQQLLDQLKLLKESSKTLKNQLDEIYKDIQSAYKDIENKLTEQAKKQIEFSNQKVKLLQKEIDFITQVYKSLLKQIPKIEPDQKTQLSRELAMALGSITALIHPSYAPYFYMAIPQIVQYWRNEDMINFENAMRKFEIAATLAGTNLEFLNKVLEKQMAVLEEKEKQDLLPTTLTLKLLTEKYTNYIDLYNNLWPKYLENVNNQIANVIKLLEAKERERHNRAEEKLREQTIRLQTEIRKELNKLRTEEWKLKKTEKLAPWSVPSKIFEILIKQAADPEEVLEIIESFEEASSSGSTSLLDVIEKLKEKLESKERKKK
jgi:hypothetical protein